MAFTAETVLTSTLAVIAELESTAEAFLLWDGCWLQGRRFAHCGDYCGTGVYCRPGVSCGTGVYFGTVLKLGIGILRRCSCSHI